MMTSSPNQKYSDEALCALAASGDHGAEDRLVARYSRLVRICARPYFLAGGDSEDLSQEGMFGLLKAIREFDFRRDVSFHTFAELCIRRRILSAVAAASRDKHVPLNESLPLEPFFSGDSTVSYTEPQSSDNPEDILIAKEEQREWLGYLKGQLSGLESNILACYLQGCSYREIARQVGRSDKSVDNAVQRIRRKIARHISSGVYSES